MRSFISKLKHRFRKNRSQNKAKDFEKDMMGKSLCDLVGHDWQSSVERFYQSNVETRDRYCKRCGETEHEVNPV